MTNHDVSVERTTTMAKSILILVNPKSGRGKSIKCLEKVLIPLLDEQNIWYEVQITEQHKRVEDILSETNIRDLAARYRSIVVVSGDGLLHETINAILSRSDWQESIKLPLGIVPTGSGNGLAYTLIRRHFKHLAAGQRALKLCCQQAIQQDGTCTSDLVKLTYGKSRSIWSFLSIGWGLLSDIDVDSDWLRCLGELRFTLYGLLRSCTARSHRGKLSYLAKSSAEASIVRDAVTSAPPPPEPTTIASTTADPSPEQTKQPAASDHSEASWTHVEGYFTCLYAVYQAHISSSTKFAPKSTLTDSTIYLTYIRGHLSVLKSVEFLLAIEDGSHDKLNYVTVVPVERFSFEPLEPSKVVVDGDTIGWTHEDGPLSAEIVPKMMKLAWSDRLVENMEASAQV